MKLIKRPSARFLVTFAITLVVLSLHFAAILIGIVPDSEAIQREGRAALAEVLTVRSVRHLAASEMDILEEGLELLVERNADVLSASVRRAGGDVLIHVGQDTDLRDIATRNYSTANVLTVPIMESGRQWGQLNLRFAPLHRAGWIGVFDRPLVRYGLFLAVIGFIALYFVLGKMLSHLDPSKAVPTRVRSALDTMMEGLIAVDLRGRIVLSNVAFSAVAGKSADQLLGARIASLRWELPSSDEDEALPPGFPWEQTLADGTPCTNAPIHFIDSDSKRRTFLVNCSPVLGGEGSHVGVLVGLGDVTELEEKEIELRLSKDRAEAANRAKSEFLANISHEIRTPMNAILGFTDMLRRGYARSESDHKKFLGTIHSSGTFLLELINDLLDLSKVESGALDLEVVPCALQDIAGEVVNVLSVKAQEQGIDLELTIDTPMPATINSDPLRLRQIVTNLVGNAIKFTEQGSVRVGLSYDPQRGPRSVSVAIADTGIAMTAEQIDKVFDPFTQADRSITRRFGGTGLGLSISKRFIEALDGNIEVTSTPGAGSVFTVHIDPGSLADVPILTPDVVLTQAATPAQDAGRRWIFEPGHVVVADDNRQNRELLQLVLGEHGLTVTTAQNGREAVAAASARDVDVVLMDLEMPVMDGATATRALRDAGFEMPILALTAHAFQGVEETITQAGFSEYLSKPIDIAVLLERLAQLLGAVSSEPVGNDTAIVTTPLYSRLPTDDPRYRDIVEEFIGQLAQRLQALDAARDAADYAALKQLAHSLKGVGSSVGFDDFVEPCERLEQAALDATDAAIEPCLGQLRSLAGRVTADAGPQAPEETQPAVVLEAAASCDEPIRSSLPVADPRYRAIVVDFIDELDARLEAMEEALNTSDFDELAGLCHALKGVAGGVGFDEFTEPTRTLETAAIARDVADAQAGLSVLQALARRIERPTHDEARQASNA